MEWRVSERPVEYPAAVEEMEARAAAIRAGTAEELVWLLEHPPLYTAGTSARDSDLLAPDSLPVYRTGRGGQFTYHGPGQRVVYAMLDLEPRGRDIRAYIRGLSDWAIGTLERMGVRTEWRDGDRVGVWVVHPDGREDKIAAFGVRVKKWVTMHGMAINLAPDLSHYAGIVPCGIRAHGVTSLRALGSEAGLAELDAALKESFSAAFPPKPR